MDKFMRVFICGCFVCSLAACSIFLKKNHYVCRYKNLTTGSEYSAAGATYYAAKAAAIQGCQQGSYGWHCRFSQCEDTRAAKKSTA